MVADMEDDFYWACLGDGQIHDIHRNNLLVLKDSFLKDNMRTLHRMSFGCGDDYSTEVFLGKPTKREAELFIKDDADFILSDELYWKLMSGEQIVVPDEYYDIEVWMS